MPFVALSRRHNTSQFSATEGASVIEMLYRLGFALLLSVGLALLLAWGWSSSDDRTAIAADGPSTASQAPTPLR